MTREVKIIFTIGISASGKSSWAIQEAVVNKTTRVVERDVLRKIIFRKNGNAGPFSWSAWKWKWEKQVTELWKQEIDKLIALPDLETIICSDTNLNKKRLVSNMQKIVERNPEVKIIFSEKYFPISYEEAVKRDAGRELSVGAFVIGRQYEQWCKLTIPDLSVKIEGLPKAILVDLDGTFAHNTSGRGPYDDFRYDEDTRDDFLFNLIRVMSVGGYVPIFLSGRESTLVGKEKTECWLKKNTPENLEYKLFMRELGDRRPDSIVKKELFSDYVHGKFNVEAVFDDRPAVCRMWRSIGLPVYQCGNPHIEF